MADDEENEKGFVEGVMQQSKAKAGDRIVHALSTAATRAVDGATKHDTDLAVAVCREDLARMASEQSIVNTCDVRQTGKNDISMAPLINGMLWACSLTLDQPSDGVVWVVCAPSNQGKTFAMEYLIHGEHSFRPTRSLKIDATNMKNFPKECATLLNCPAAAKSLALTLCQAVSGKVAGTHGATNFAAKASYHVGKSVCEPDMMIPCDAFIKMRDAGEHNILQIGEGSTPCPILVIDEFYWETEENANFISLLYKEASKLGVVVFVVTSDKKWATRLIKLNGGIKVKPLAANVDNVGYTGVEKFIVEPQWNDLAWEVSQLRFLVKPFCDLHSLDPAEVVPANSKLNPSEAMKQARLLLARKRMARKRMVT
jgi:hypothetical protein